MEAQGANKFSSWPDQQAKAQKPGASEGRLDPVPPLLFLLPFGLTFSLQCLEERGGFSCSASTPNKQGVQTHCLQRQCLEFSLSGSRKDYGPFLARTARIQEAQAAH